jgi:hypothetical protein
MEGHVAHAITELGNNNRPGGKQRPASTLEHSTPMVLQR